MKDATVMRDILEIVTLKEFISRFECYKTRDGGDLMQGAARQRIIIRTSQWLDYTD